MALVQQLPVGKLAPVVNACPVEARAPLREAAQRQVEALLDETGPPDATLLKAAGEFLPLEKVLPLCLRTFGRSYPGASDPRATAMSILLAHATEAAPLWRQYLRIALVLERKLEDILEHSVAEARDPMNRSPAPDREADPHEQAWMLVLRTAESMTRRGAYWDEASIIPHVQQIVSDYSPIDVLAMGLKLGPICRDLLRCASHFGDESDPPWLVYGLLAQSNVDIYIPAFNALLSLQQAALPQILRGLRQYPEIAGSLIQLTNRIWGDEPPAEVVGAVAEAGENATGPGLADVTMFLAKQRQPAAIPLITRLLRHDQAYLRAAGIYAASYSGDGRFLPAVIAALLYPIQCVREEAHHALLRWDPRARGEVLSQPRRAAHSRCAVLQLKALDLLWCLEDEALPALIDELRRGHAAPEELLDELSEAPPPPPGNPRFVPTIFTAPGQRGFVTPRWRKYRLQLCRNPKLFRLFTEFNEMRMVNDEQYLEVRDAVASGRPCLRWFLLDVVEHYTLQLRGVFQLYSGVEIPEEVWQGAVAAGCRRLDRDYLTKQWQRGRPELVLGQAEGQHWTLALRWLIEDELRQALSDQINRALTTVTYTDPRQQVVHEWLRLSCFPNWYWGYDLRPRLGDEELVRYVVKTGWELKKGSSQVQVHVAHQIIDYFAMYATLLPCPAEHKLQCQQRLIECFQPLVGKQWRKWLRASLRRDAQPWRKIFDDLVEKCARDALKDYDPFWKGPREPLWPLGLPIMRMFKLPETVYGRGIPFTHFFERRLSRMLADFDGKSGEVPVGSPETVTKRSTRKTLETATVVIAGMVVGASQVITDNQGNDWLTIRRLSALTKVPESSLRRYEAEGIVPFERLKGCRAIAADDTVSQVVRDVVAHRILKHPKQPVSTYKVHPKTISRWIDALPSDFTPYEKLLRLQSEHQPPQR